jgi:sugar phosphate isomerase/epimerase
MRVGIGSWTFPWAIGVSGYPAPKEPLDAIGLLQRAKDLGVSVVQIADNLPLHILNERQLEALRKESLKRGITLEVGTRGVEPAHLLIYLNIAKYLGAKIVRTLITTADSSPDLDQVEAYIREVVPQFAANDVSIALENYETHKVRDLAALVERIQSKHVGICLDTVNSLAALEVPQQVVGDLAPYVLSLHIKDFNIRRVRSMMGFSVMGCPAGDGRLDIGWIVAQLARHVKNPNMILELWTPFCETVEKTVTIEQEWACKSVRFLMKYEVETQGVGP